MKSLQNDITEIYSSAIQSVDPKTAILNSFSREGSRLVLHNGNSTKHYNLDSFKNIYVIGAGKATAPMALAMEELLENYISEGVICVKYGYTEPLKTITCLEASHPTPDKNGTDAAIKIFELAKKADTNDLVISLISGGGSALLPMPPKGISVADKVRTTNILLSCGATIHEINSVRKHISMIKGGHLAKAASPATVLNILISDVVGDDIDVIASGPLTPDISSFTDAYNVLQKYNVVSKIPETVLNYLKEGAKGLHEETSKPGDSFFNQIDTHILVSNFTALHAAKLKAEKLGYNTLILSSLLQGETEHSVEFHSAIVNEIKKTGNPVEIPACILSGGENSVIVQGKGKGGRNTEFAIHCAKHLSQTKGVCAASIATDGSDGPTDSAGAWCNNETLQVGKKLGLNIDEYISNNDSYSYFSKIGSLVKTGPTNTNVMDIHIFLINNDVKD